MAVKCEEAVTEKRHFKGIYTNRAEPGNDGDTRGGRPGEAGLEMF